MNCHVSELSLPYTLFDTAEVCGTVKTGKVVSGSVVTAGTGKVIKVTISLHTVIHSANVFFAE